MSMIAPAQTLIMHYNPETNAFQTNGAESSWSVELHGEFRWHFKDMDSDRDIVLHPDSAKEAEAGYQAWRRYHDRLNDPHGREGSTVELPPKEIEVHLGFYRGKEYRISFSISPASRSSNNPIAGNRHVEVYQQNCATGFMRTLYRTPTDSISKPYSGLQVASKVYVIDTAHERQIFVDVAAGKSFFGYEYERTIFTFTFVIPDDAWLAQRVMEFYEDEEMLQLEVPRDENNVHHIFPRLGGRGALLVVRQGVYDAGLQQEQMNRQVVNDADVVFPFEQINRDVVGEIIEGEPDVEEFSDEKMDVHPGNPGLSKFDVYSYVDRVRQFQNEHDVQYIFNQIPNVRERSFPEYEQYHFGDPPLHEIQVDRATFRNFVEKILVSRDDVACIIFDNIPHLHEGHASLTETNASAICKDAIYNKIISGINNGKIGLVTVRVSEQFVVDYGEEGRMGESSASASLDAEDGHFVTYLGFGGKFMMITRQNFAAAMDRFDAGFGSC